MFDRHSLDYDPALETWGWYSVPPKAARELKLGEFLAKLPVGATVLDVGAGAGMSMAAATFVERQDLNIVSLDPGYGLPDIEDAIQSDTDNAITYFEPQQQELLRGSDEWRKKRLVGYAEKLPVEDHSVDLLLSYSAVPLYSPETSVEIALECSRVLKVGAIALHGPISDYAFDEWQLGVNQVLSEGGLADFSAREEIENAHDNLIKVRFTEITR